MTWVVALDRRRGRVIYKDPSLSLSLSRCSRGGVLEEETESEVDADYCITHPISEVHSESEDEDDDDGTDSDGTSIISYFSHSDSDNEEVLGSSEGECGSEGEDGEGASGTVGEGGPGDAKVEYFPM